MNRKLKTLLTVAVVIPGSLFAGRIKPEVEHAMAYGAEAKICLKVHDDLEQPVSNASVAVVFDMLPSPHSVLRATQEVRCAVCRVLRNDEAGDAQNEQLPA